MFERRSCGNGSKGPRYSDWAMTATAVQGQYLLIRRLLSRPDSYTFYLCWAPPDRPATMTYFITIGGRRRPVETTFQTGKDVFGWDQTQTPSTVVFPVNSRRASKSRRSRQGRQGGLNGPS